MRRREFFTRVTTALVGGAAMTTAPVVPDVPAPATPIGKDIIVKLEIDGRVVARELLKHLPRAGVGRV